MKHLKQKMTGWAIGLATTVSVMFSSCEEYERPEPVNHEFYHVTELTIHFNDYDLPSYISFLAVKPGGNECTSGPQSLFEFEAEIDDWLTPYEASAFIEFDFDMKEYFPRDRFGNGLIDAQIYMETNTGEGIHSFGFRDCARAPDAMTLYLDNAFITTNAYDQWDAEKLLEHVNEEGEYEIASGRALYLQGDFIP